MICEENIFYHILLLLFALINFKKLKNDLCSPFLSMTIISFIKGESWNISFDAGIQRTSIDSVSYSAPSVSGSLEELIPHPPGKQSVLPVFFPLSFSVFPSFMHPKPLFRKLLNIFF